jgi:hypothetical protein
MALLTMARAASSRWRLPGRVPPLRGLRALLPGVAIGRRQSIRAHGAELAEPLFGGEVRAVIGLLAIIPPPAHRYLHTAYHEDR